MWEAKQPSSSGMYWAEHVDQMQPEAEVGVQHYSLLPEDGRQQWG